MAKTLGAALKGFRQTAGYSLSAVSKLTGMSPSQISQIENGARKNPAFDTVARIAKALKISLDEVALATGADYELTRPSDSLRASQAAMAIERRLLEVTQILLGLADEVRREGDRIQAFTPQSTVKQVE